MELLQNQKKTHTNTVSRSVTKEQKQFNGERVLLKKKKKGDRTNEHPTQKKFNQDTVLMSFTKLTHSESYT